MVTNLGFNKSKVAKLAKAAIDDFCGIHSLCNKDLFYQTIIEENLNNYLIFKVKHNRVTYWASTSSGLNKTLPNSRLCIKKLPWQGFQRSIQVQQQTSQFGRQKAANGGLYSV